MQEANDERLRRINEVVHGIKVIKLSSWEEQYEKKVRHARNRELRLLNVDSLHWAVMSKCVVQLDRKIDSKLTFADSFA